MYHLTGNPLFPYFNQYFESPLVAGANFRDTRFLPARFENSPALSAAVLHRLAGHQRSALRRCARGAGLCDGDFDRDRLGDLASRRRNHWCRPTPPVRCSPLPASSYAAWLSFFAIYRYILSLEMLAPILIVAAIGLWPLKRGTQLSLIGVALLFAIVNTRAAHPATRSGGRSLCAGDAAADPASRQHHDPDHRRGADGLPGAGAAAADSGAADRRLDDPTRRRLRPDRP